MVLDPRWDKISIPQEDPFIHEMTTRRLPRYSTKEFLIHKTKTRRLLQYSTYEEARSLFSKKESSFTGIKTSRLPWLALLIRLGSYSVTRWLRQGQASTMTRQAAQCIIATPILGGWCRFNDTSMPWFRILNSKSWDFDSRLAGCGTCVIDGLFFQISKR